MRNAPRRKPTRFPKPLMPVKHTPQSIRHMLPSAISSEIQSPHKPMQLGFAKPTEEEKLRHCMYNLCFYCGELGHHSIGCPYKARRSTNSTIEMVGECWTLLSPPKSHLCFLPELLLKVVFFFQFHSADRLRCHPESHPSRPHQQIQHSYPAMHSTNTNQRCWQQVLWRWHHSADCAPTTSDWYVSPRSHFILCDWVTSPQFHSGKSNHGFLSMTPPSPGIKENWPIGHNSDTLTVWTPWLSSHVLPPALKALILNTPKLFLLVTITF